MVRRPLPGALTLTRKLEPRTTLVSSRVFVVLRDVMLPGPLKSVLLGVLAVGLALGSPWQSSPEQGGAGVEVVNPPPKRAS
jgi:hypothetical protein